jgi:hypothetical protein
MLKYGLTSALLAGSAMLTAAQAAETNDPFSATGSIGVELRIFPDDPEFAGQRDETFHPSIFGKLDLGWTWDGGRQKVLITPYGRYDVYDDRRTHYDLREASYAYRGDGFDVLIGAHQVFWGRAESRHLVNVINQVDLVENFDGEEYLGQPMVNLNISDDWGKLGLYGMTGFRERTFPARDARLRGPIPVDVHNEIYQRDAEEWAPDFAVRYENSINAVDFGFSYFHGTNREPFFMPCGTLLCPFYELMNQAAVDGSYVIGDFVFKAEALYRWGHSDPFFATVFGGEYTIKNAFDDDIDVGLLLEYNHDDRNATNPGTVFDNDVFGGVRFTFRDKSDTQVLFGALVDVENGSTYAYVESSTRLDDDWRAGVEGRLFSGDDGDPIDLVDHDSYIAVKVTRYITL